MMASILDKINNFLLKPAQKNIENLRDNIVPFQPKLVEKSVESETPVIIGITTLKVRMNSDYCFSWTTEHYDTNTTDVPVVFREFTNWYNSPKPEQIATHYVMLYTNGETMIRRADIISYEIRYDEL